MDGENNHMKDGEEYDCTSVWLARPSEVRRKDSGSIMSMLRSKGSVLERKR
jgi:hypothetical protein